MKLKNIILFLYAISLLSLPIRAELLITQVLYDPEGADTGKEWIEIYNPADELIPLDMYSIETGNGALEDSWTLEWNGTGETISAHGFFLIAENESIADHMTSLDLQNGPDGVRLLLIGDPISTVGWGDLTFPEYFEGSPSPLTGPGESLQRSYSWEGSSRVFSDSTDNSRDFTASIPQPRSSSYGGLEVEVFVQDDSLILSNLTLDGTIGENRIIPLPGKDKQITVRVIIESASGIDNISVTGSSLDAQFDLAPDGQLGPTKGAFIGAFPLPFSTSPGSYPLTISADMETAHEEITTSFEVMAVSAVEIDTGVLSFPASAKGSTFELPGDEDMETADLPTLRNIGNEDIDIVISGTDLISDSGRLSISLLSYAISGITGALTSSPKTLPIGIVSGETVPLSFSVSIPTDIEGGRYTGNVLLSAITR